MRRNSQKVHGGRRSIWLIQSLKKKFFDVKF